MTYFNFPPPKDSGDFERLVEQIAPDLLRSSRVTLNGRSGQAQQGVDISVTTDDGEIGIQCKVTQALKIDTVRDEIDKALTYKPTLNHFIVATTARSDAPLQESVRLLTVPFKVSLWSWDKINNQLNRQPAAALDYVQLVLMGTPESSERKHAVNLREAFDRPAFLHDAHSEGSFREQLDGLADTSKFLRTGLLYTRDQHLVSALPYRRYGVEHARAAQAILARVDKMATTTQKRLPVLNDSSHPQHQKILNETEKLRIDVLEAVNNLLGRFDLPPLPFRT